MRRRGFIKALTTAVGVFLAPKGTCEPLPEKLEAPYMPAPKPEFATEQLYRHEWGDCISGSCTMGHWGYFITGGPDPLTTRFLNEKFYPQLQYRGRFSKK